MKKIIVLIVIVLLFCCNILFDSPSYLTDLNLINVEALADGEIINDCPSDGNGCYDGTYWYSTKREAWW